MTPRDTTLAVSQRLDTLRERHPSNHWCDGSVGPAIYDFGTPCDAIQQADRADTAEALLHEAMKLIAKVDGCHGCVTSSYEDEYASLLAHYDAQYGDTGREHVGDDTERSRHAEPEQQSVTVGHVPPFGSVKDEGRRP